MNLEEFAKKEALLNKNEIFSFNFEDKKYWLKRARKTKPNRIQKFFYRIFPFELLIPALAKDSKEALLFETTKIEKFKELEINVPNIIYKNEHFFVLEDGGKTIYSILRDENIEEKNFYFYIDLVLKELAKMHSIGFFHGGSQLRNFTFKNEKVFVIDFEESFDENIDVRSLQHRDFLLFLLSFLKIKELSFKIDYEKIINRYLEISKNYEIKDKLLNFSGKLQFFLYLYKKEFIRKRVGSDVKYFFELIEILNNMDKNAK
ncbi:BUD32 family EKC/KEOPS complex subunit [Aliarcobacter butzleri]|uniref:kinase n=1 Tax=Aliarcobacter butzleri TaxID=28197 RepID=UPI001260973C|nr:kinase [Aliarcobacter butzleri]